MTAVELIMAGLIVAVAVVAQAGTGSGFGIIAAPLLLMVSPDLVPGPLLVVSLAVMLLVTWQNRSGLQRLDLRFALLGCLPGALAGLCVLPLLNARWTALIVGVLVVASVLAGLARVQVPQTRGSLFTAGALGGVLGTVAATSGPPLVVVYRSMNPHRYRGNLSLFFLVASFISLLGLVVSGSFSSSGLLSSCWLLPGVVLGGLASRPVVRRLPAAALRPAALGLCLVAGAGLIIKGSFS